MIDFEKYKIRVSCAKCWKYVTLTHIGLGEFRGECSHCMITLDGGITRDG